ncbi:MAG: hypothetical protein ACOZAK_03785 [Patescibacteria group bacterium]
MGPTKTQLLEELKNQGLDEETYQAVVQELASIPEQMSAEDISKVDQLLAKMGDVEKVSAYAYGEMADTLDKAADDLTDLADNYIETAAKTTYNNVKLAQDLSE